MKRKINSFGENGSDQVLIVNVFKHCSDASCYLRSYVAFVGSVFKQNQVKGIIVASIPFVIPEFLEDSLVYSEKYSEAVQGT